MVNVRLRYQSKQRNIDRDEAAAILRELWRGPPTKAWDDSLHRSSGKTRHAARLFSLLLYTGSRYATVAKTNRKNRKNGPWVDKANEIWFRRGDDEKVTNKRWEPHRVPARSSLLVSDGSGCSQTRNTWLSIREVQARQ